MSFPAIGSIAGGVRRVSARQPTLQHLIAAGGAGPDYSGLLVGLESYWAMEEGVGATRIDQISGHNLTGTGIGTAAGKHNTCAEATAYNSANKLVSSGALPAFWAMVNAGESFSISLWVYFTAVPVIDYHGVISFWNGAQISYFVWFANNSTLNISVVGNTSGGLSWDVGVPTTGTWHHIAMGYDDSTGLSWAHWDGGARQTAATVGGVRRYAGGTGWFEIFRYEGDTGSPNMRADEVAWWRRSLSVAEVAMLYNSGTGIFIGPMFS